jgi:hypothetical protein
MWTDPWNLQITHRHMNEEIRIEAAQSPENKYTNGIFVAVHIAVYSLGSFLILRPLYYQLQLHSCSWPIPGSIV